MNGDGLDMLSVRVGEGYVKFVDNDIIGYYFKDIRKFKPLNRDEEVMLIRKAQEGDAESAEKILCSHLRFVVSIAKKLADNRKVNVMDLISEGNLGLYEAIYRYDISRAPEAKFISFAVHYILRNMMHYIASNYTIVKVSPALLNKMYKIKRCLSAQDVTNSIDVSHVVEKVFPKYKNKEVMEKRVIEALNAGEYCTISELLESKDAEKQELNLDDGSFDAFIAKSENNDLKLFIERVAGILIKSHQTEDTILGLDIVKMRLGFVKGYALTMHEIAEILNISVERVQYLYEKTLFQIKRLIIRRRELAAHLSEIAGL